MQLKQALKQLALVLSQSLLREQPYLILVLPVALNEDNLLTKRQPIRVVTLTLVLLFQSSLEQGHLRSISYKR